MDRRKYEIKNTEERDIPSSRVTLPYKEITSREFDGIMISHIGLGKCPMCGSPGGNIVIELPYYGVHGARVECPFCTYSTDRNGTEIFIFAEEGRIGTPTTEESILLGIMKAGTEWNETEKLLELTTTHELKILPKYFDEVYDRVKNFEVRKNDRNYAVGDTLILREWDGTAFTGRRLLRRVGYILSDPEYVKEGYVVLGFAGTAVQMAKRKVENDEQREAD